MIRSGFEEIARKCGCIPFTDEVGNYLERIVEILGESLIEISIFGSTARGERRKDSDIDVLVIVKGGHKEAFEALDTVSRSLGDLWWGLVIKGVQVNITVVGSDVWEWMKKIGMPFALNVEGEKIVLYRKDP